MRLIVSFILFGPLVLRALAAPTHNAEAGPSTAGGTSSSSTDPSHPGSTVEFGKVYGVASQDYKSGPPDHPLFNPESAPPSEDANRKTRKLHAHRFGQVHPFIPTRQEGKHYKGFALTHNPPNAQGSNAPEPHVAASAYGKFDSTKTIAGQEVVQKSHLLTTPRWVAPKDIKPRPPGAPERLDEGKFEQLKKDRTYSYYVFHNYCGLFIVLSVVQCASEEPEGMSGEQSHGSKLTFTVGYRCSRRSKGAANRKSSTVSKVKAHSKATKSHGRASQKHEGRKGFAGKSKPMMKVKGPAGGRGAGRSKKGHK
jgi:hypothetical protein